MKDWLELLNETNIDLDEYKEETLNDIEKKTLKNNLKKSIRKNKTNKYKKPIIASAVILSIIISTNIKVIADTLEKLISRNPTESFQNYNKTKLDEYKNIIDKSVTNNGVTITINEFIFDYDNIIVTYTLEGEKIDTQDINILPKILIDGKEVKRRGVSATYSGENKNLRQFILEPRDPITKSGEFDVKILIGGKDDFSQDRIIEEGKWEFNFRANNLAINEFIEKFDLNKNINLNKYGSICMKRVIKTPMSTIVELSSENLLVENENVSVGCILEDSDGNILEKISEQKRYDYSDLERGTYIYRFKSINRESKTIKVTPIILLNSVYDENSKYNKELREYSLELNLSK
ncbi:DUF4179 domain-containing protein [Asaccharospora irregularis]|uniref:DUF4179 domain-containing protein n=1 Tax=Asaccharospora irregularis DSM 2635 TaxID=1121321 RepID=A0A1M5LDW1_9FIRM|nr:DUF4179 domain-containing protein [Asaccharospora irregularis]SHG62553.1 protein of unknown function [Asaccharospora irregularis DSM 2635]